jgi:ribonuclease Z
MDASQVSGEVLNAEHAVQATFGSERKEGSQEFEYEAEALAKRHSMTHEAVEAGRRAAAYRTILSHFSQRYPKIPVVDDTFRASTCIAFDLMSVNLQGVGPPLLSQAALCMSVPYNEDVCDCLSFSFLYM